MSRAVIVVDIATARAVRDLIGRFEPMHESHLYNSNMPGDLAHVFLELCEKLEPARSNMPDDLAHVFLELCEKLEPAQGTLPFTLGGSRKDRRLADRRRR